MLQTFSQFYVFSLRIYCCHSHCPQSIHKQTHTTEREWDRGRDQRHTSFILNERKITTNSLCLYARVHRLLLFGYGTLKSSVHLSIGASTIYEMWIFIYSPILVSATHSLMCHSRAKPNQSPFLFSIKINLYVSEAMQLFTINLYRCWCSTLLSLRSAYVFILDWCYLRARTHTFRTLFLVDARQYRT